jgi:hypothetical protein
LKGETEPAEDLLRQAAHAVRTIGNGKRIVIVDGVGYPSVGSICNLSNGKYSDNELFYFLCLASRLSVLPLF